MITLLICMVAYIFIGGMGMWLGSRKVSRGEALQRWLKYGVYIFITGVIITCITQHVFIWLACLIIIAGLYEIIKAARLNKILLIKALVTYSLIVTGFILFIFKYDDHFILYVYFQVFTFDAFSQVCGQLFGKHKLAPNISAGKTVEGFIGGSLFCILSAIVGKNYVDISFIKAIVVGSFIAITSLSGDLLASYLKRRCGIKDYSKLLTGQGGFLDRFDSLLMAGAYYYILWLMIK